ncbi:MAG: hypothetical protein R3272_07585 [Candidatus Promineifilaceae bacterium]|nr:hypothetical protein [Candidatus Promineifilaceae bacterium]
MTRILNRWLRRVGLPRLTRLLLLISLPPMWLEIAILHYRGSFQSPFMWLPIAGLPLVVAGGVATLFAGDDGRERALFRPLAWLATALGAAGTLFHIGGVKRQMGGFYNLKYNLMTGPPVPAPPQLALLGLAAVVASDPGEVGKSRYRQRRKLVRRLFLIEALAAASLAIEAGYEHYKGYFFNPFMLIPVTLGPALAVVHLAALVWQRPTRALRRWLSAAAMVLSLVGFAFHVYNVTVRRTGGFSWQNLFYGAPVVAPLQLFAHGALGLLAAFFEEP